MGKKICDDLRTELNLAFQMAAEERQKIFNGMMAEMNSTDMNSTLMNLAPHDQAGPTVAPPVITDEEHRRADERRKFREERQSSTQMTHQLSEISPSRTSGLQ